MKFSLFLFLLLFTLTTSDFVVRVLQIGHGKNAKEIQYKPDSRLNHEKGYILLVWDPDESNTNNRKKGYIIYWTGTQLKRSIKLEVIHLLTSTIEEIDQHLTADIYIITREMSNSKINNFEALISANVPAPKRIPRLYKVAGAYNIRQIPLICDKVNDEDSFVLDGESVVTVYHSPSASNKKRRIANLLADYIIREIENNTNYNPSYISYLGDKKNPGTAFETFCDKILNSKKLYFQKKMDYSPNKHVRNSKDVNETATNTDNKYFEKAKQNVQKFLKKYMLSTRTDTVYSDGNLSSPTISTPTVPAYAGKMFEAAKKKYETKISSFLESVFKSESKNVASTSEASGSGNNTFFESVFKSESENVSTTSEAAGSGNNKHENLIPIFLGPEKCAPKTLFLIGTLESSCVYALKDLENNELFIYLGKFVDIYYYKMVLMAAEIDMDENPFVTLTIIVEGQRIPTSFMIHIENEINRLINKKNLLKLSWYLA